MKKHLLAVMLIAALQSHAQVFWTETFSNGCTSGCLASSYSGPNGAWTIVSTGANVTSSNKWFVSGAECGNAAGQCGTACGATDASLHVGADIIIVVDPGAAYYNAAASNWRTESPVINCTGKSNISVDFNYIMEGEPNGDFAALAYYDGSSWFYYNGTIWTATFSSLPVTNNSSCAPQGLWSAYSVMLPASANNNANVKIGFQWTNDTDANATDPSFAVDDINISATAPACAVSINPIFPAILCYGDCNSALSTTATGVGLITYQWSTIPVQNTSTASNLCAGTYTVTITDSTGCTSSASATITQPSQLVVDSVVLSNYSGWNVTCNGACDGMATIYVSGGTPPITYLWSNGCTGQTCGNLCVGTYTVTITDANGCTVTTSFTITEPPLLTMGAPTVTNPSCTGCTDGSICAGTVSGGTPSYSYQWTPSVSTTGCANNIGAGIYTVCVVDANGCTACTTDTLVDPPSGIADNFFPGEIILSPNIISTAAVLTIPFEQEFSFIVYDCFGNKVREKIFNGKQMIIEKENLSAGLYFFELTGNRKRLYIGKFIIE